MMKRYITFFLFIFTAFTSFSQGTESFSNLPTTTPSSYLDRTWTGDNLLTWTATDSRTDGPTDGSINGISGKFIIVRNGKIICLGIPNGCGTVTFTYALAYTGAGSLALFINGTQFGTTVSVSSNIANTVTIPVNANGTFDLEIRQLTSGTKARVAIDNVIWTTNNSVPCIEPTEQPTNLNLTATPNTISGTFTSPASDPDEFLIVRSFSSTLSASPADGANYSTGQTMGGGTVVSIISGNSFADTNLSPSTNYYYFIFSINDQDCGGGPNYLQLNPLTGNTATLALPACTTPTQSPTNLVLIAANKSISGSFTQVAGANKYLVVISPNATLSALPANGSTFTAGQSFGGGTVVSFGNQTSFIASGLTVATQYYFYVFAANSECSGEPFYNTNSLNETTSTTNNTSGVPTGYYDAATDLTCQPLKTKLRDIVSTGYNQLTYTPGVWNVYQYSDIHRNDDNTADIIWDIYSDNPTGPEPYTYTYQTSQCGNYTKEGDCYNREHSTPKSWFNDAYPMYTDVNHLYPTDGYVNAMRSNYPYGEVTNATYTSKNGSKLGTGNNFGYTGTIFEPINEYKGDLARTSLYMATRYENEIIVNNWSANGTADALFLSPSDEPDPAKRKLQIYDTWYLKTIFKWIGQDPVSQKEIDRNNAVYYQSGQGNRNPFIDHPEYAALIFQCTGALPVTIIDFVAAKQNEAVQLNWYATYETNFKEFEVERSADGVHFYKIGQVQGKNLANYSFTDNNLPEGSTVFYQLKMIDIDGKYQFSKVVVIRLNNNFSNAIVFPNPVANTLTIQLKSVLVANSELQIVDLAGRMLKKETIRNGSNTISQDVSKFPAGRYFIKISNPSQVINSSFIIMK